MFFKNRKFKLIICYLIIFSSASQSLLFKINAGNYRIINLNQQKQIEDEKAFEFYAIKKSSDSNSISDLNSEKKKIEQNNDDLKKALQNVKSSDLLLKLNKIKKKKSEIKNKLNKESSNILKLHNSNSGIEKQIKSIENKINELNSKKQKLNKHILQLVRSNYKLSCSQTDFNACDNFSDLVIAHKYNQKIIKLSKDAAVQINEITTKEQEHLNNLKKLSNNFNNNLNTSKKNVYSFGKEYDKLNSCYEEELQIYQNILSKEKQIKSNKDSISAIESKIANIQKKLEDDKNLKIAKENAAKLPSVKPQDKKPDEPKQDQKKQEQPTQQGSDNYQFPVVGNYNISEWFGARRGHHKGIDIATNGKHNAVVAARKGVVVRAGVNLPGCHGYGRCVEIKHADGTTTFYAHLHSHDVKVGEYVNCGQKIGNVGSSGDSRGIHLHFEYRINGRPVNPCGILKLKNPPAAKQKPKNQNNPKQNNHKPETKNNSKKQKTDQQNQSNKDKGKDKNKNSKNASDKAKQTKRAKS